MTMAAALCLFGAGCVQNGPEDRALARDATGRTARPTLRLMTFNVMHEDLQPRLGEIAGYIAGKDPDVVVIQEMHQQFHAFLPEIQATGYPAFFHTEMDYWVFLSRTPIEDFEKFPDGVERWIHTFRTTLASGQRIRILHLHPHPRQPCEPARALLEVAARYEEDETFLTGDFNLSRTGSCYPEILEAGYLNACDPQIEPSCRGTVNYDVWCRYHDCPDGPQAKPAAAIDHIFHRRDSAWRLVRAYADHRIRTSDHYPVVAEYTPWVWSPEAESDD